MSYKSSNLSQLSNVYKSEILYNIYLTYLNFLQSKGLPPRKASGGDLITSQKELIIQIFKKYWENNRWFQDYTIVYFLIDNCFAVSGFDSTFWYEYSFLFETLIIELWYLSLQEAIGMTQEIVKVLQDKAQALTGERRRKSKTVPEQLVDADTIKDR